MIKVLLTLYLVVIVIISFIIMIPFLLLTWKWTTVYENILDCYEEIYLTIVKDR